MFWKGNNAHTFGTAHSTTRQGIGIYIDFCFWAFFFGMPFHGKRREGALRQVKELEDRYTRRPPHGEGDHGLCIGPRTKFKVFTLWDWLGMVSYALLYNNMETFSTGVLFQNTLSPLQCVRLDARRAFYPFLLRKAKRAGLERRGRTERRGCFLYKTGWL